MIWVRGSIVPDEALAIGVSDRSFEHGLGLFETLRTWGGRPTLLVRHLDRLERSAEALGLGLDRRELPGPADVAALVEAEGVAGDCALRITLSGGFDDGRPGTVWMRARPLPPPIPGPGARIRPCGFVAEWDPLLAHKTLNYWSRRLAFERAKAEGFDEALMRDASGSIVEGSRTNLFLVEAGRLVTPALRRPDGREAPLLPGIMRGVVLERAGAIGWHVEPRSRVTVEAIARADECFLTNAGRGIIPVARFVPDDPADAAWDRTFEAPGLVTRRLMADLEDWLRSEDAR